MKFSELRQRIRFWRATDRLGPDIPITHWRLHFKSTMAALCREKFKVFGEGAEFRPGAYAVGCSSISIGRRVVIRPGTMLHANPSEADHGIVIQDDVLIGSGVHIYVDKHAFDNPQVPIIDQGQAVPASVVLKRGCWIGANAVILPGVTIGENSVVGAGSVVTRSIGDRMLAAGNPAKVIRSIEQPARP